MSLETIHAETMLANVRNKKAVWEILSNFSNYSRFIDSVTSVSIIEPSNATEATGKSEWNISLDGAPIHWIEKDVFHTSQLRIDFEALDGDFDEFSGHWKVQEKGSGILLSLTLEYRMSIPVIEVALGGILKEKFQDFASSLVEGLGREIGGQGADLLKEEAPAYNITDTTDTPKQQKTDKIAIYEVEESRKKSTGAA